MANFLDIQAHTDDDHGKSGTTRKLVKAGHKVYTIILTDNPKDLAPYGQKLRHREMLAAAEILGISDVHFLGEPDLGLNGADPRVINLFDQQIKRWPKFSGIFVHSPDDNHIDHMMGNALVRRWQWNFKDDTPTIKYALNSAANGKTEIVEQTVDFYPDFYVDISDEISIMEQADKCHGSQNGPATEQSRREGKLVMFDGVLRMAEGRAIELNRVYERMGSPRRATHAEGYVLGRQHTLPDELREFFIPTNLLDLVAGVPYKTKN